MEAIVAMTKNRVIGVNGNLPWHISGDLKYFKEKTLLATVWMGRKTFESIGHPLVKRKNVVFSKTAFFHEGVIHYSSLEKARNDFKQDRVVVIGGEQIYRATMPWINTLWVTWVNVELIGDAFFPEFENEFVLESKSECFFENGIEYFFCKYMREDMNVHAFSHKKPY